MDEITPRDLRPRVYQHGQFEGEHRMRAIMQSQSRAMNNFVIAIIAAACIGLVVYAACQRFEPALQISQQKEMRP